MATFVASGALLTFARFVLDARALGERLEALAGVSNGARRVARTLVEVMKPYPLLSLNHLTVPLANKNTSLTKTRTGKESALREPDSLWFSWTTIARS